MLFYLWRPLDEDKEQPLASVSVNVTEARCHPLAALCVPGSDFRSVDGSPVSIVVPFSSAYFCFLVFPVSGVTIEPTCESQAQGRVCGATLP